MAEPTPLIRLLIVDDDEEAYLMVRHLLNQVEGRRYELEWRGSYEAGLKAIQQQQHDLYLIDYQLREAQDGLDLIRTARERGCRRPMVLLTGIGGTETDLKAMNAGAADYLVKDELTSTMLDRTIRYTLEHQRLLDERDRQALQLRLLADEIGRAEERERRRIALLLHDELQQMLVATKMRLGNVHRQVEGAPAEELSQVQNLLDEALTICRDLTTAVSPPVLHSAGLLAACQWLARWMGEHYGLRVEVDLHDNAEPDDENIRIFLFHAIRELLFNVVKHAHADRAKLSVTPANEPQRCIRIAVEDNGAGFDPATISENDSGSLSHFGLFGIRQRIELAGGTMDIDSAPSKGTRITLLIPAQTHRRVAIDIAGALTDRKGERISPDTSSEKR